MGHLKQVCVAVLCSLLFQGSNAASNNEALQYKVVVPQEKGMISAMMLGLVNEGTVFAMDKVENNKAVDNTNKPVWSTLIDLNTWDVKALSANTNPFCAGGTVLGNGTWMVAGGNKAVGYGGDTPNTGPDNGATGPYAPYYDEDGRRTVRLLDPSPDPGSLLWQDNYNSGNQLDSNRWYPSVETLADGSALVIGGATSGGYINRNYPNVDPVYSTDGSTPPEENNWTQGGANPSFEFWPSTGKPAPAISKFMVTTSGLNMYPHTYLMPSGKVFMQANYSTVLWDAIKNVEQPLPDMPDKIVRVYPASAATAMLPLTPTNGYTPTILFCGGMSGMNDTEWGNYTAPRVNLYETLAEHDCSSITPEDGNGNMNKNVQYQREGKLPEARSMGQFIHLPNGQMVIVNGAQYGTAGYGNTTWNTVPGPGNTSIRLEGMSQSPTYRPVLYDPAQPVGQRLSSSGLGSSQIARLYHSSAILIPDGSVLVAGSNPHEDVAQEPKKFKSKYKWYPTTYAMEQWYPSYYFEQRPNVTGIPTAIPYGGPTFNVTVPASYMGSKANKLANATKIFVIRSGFSTHAVNMGQRSLQLDNSYEVRDNGDVDFIVNPMPTNMNIFVPGPALFFVTVNGIPSQGKMVDIGGSSLGTVPFTLTPGAEPGPLPAPVNNAKFGGKIAPPNSYVARHKGMSGGAIAGTVIGILALLAAALLGLLLFLRYRRRNKSRSAYSSVRTPRNNLTPPGGPYSTTVGGSPWAHATNDSLRNDQMYDDTRAHMIPMTDSQLSLHNPSMRNSFQDPIMSSEQLELKQHASAGLAPPPGQFEPDFSMDSRGMEAVPLSHLGHSPGRRGHPLPPTPPTARSSLPSVPSLSSVPSEGRDLFFSPAPTPTNPFHADQPARSSVSSVTHPVDASVAHGPVLRQTDSPTRAHPFSGMVGPREIPPARSHLDQHLDRSTQDTGIRRIQ